ncbi:MAG: PEP-CTERM sorting domain-containing protein [Proteobacteria bacterium]|nr:PEP-CTERM sorting domain-containing protein [Pseudomonadota bacterium]
MVLSMMNKTRPTAGLVFFAFCLTLAGGIAWAGPYAPAAGVTGTTAIPMDSRDFVAWATGYENYLQGAELDVAFAHAQNALGPAEGNALDVVSLGRGGSITLLFAPFADGPGWDFAVFENGFDDTFLELARVEVSSNGVHFARFPGRSLTGAPVSGFGAVDPTDVDGFAGKYRQGFGTPFDLSDLAVDPLVISGDVDLSGITRVRLLDIVGNGSELDADGRPIYDPYPTSGSAGFDLDAVGVSGGAPYPAGVYVPPATPSGNDSAGLGDEGGCFLGVAGRRKSF